MNYQRIIQHLLATRGQLHRAFPPNALADIEQAIQTSEASHAGQIRFAVEGELDGWPLFKGQTARERAIELFSLLRVWDTEHNAGLLIYVLLADRAVEIVADRGIQARVAPHVLANICRQMEAAFAAAKFGAGVVSGIQAITPHLEAHFAQPDQNRNELPDAPVVL